MQSRLLQNLDAAIQAAPDKGAWARATCRKATLLARHGELHDAARLIGAVRTEFGNALTTEAAIWVMLGEGVMSFYSGASDQGIGRFQRAHALAAAMGQTTALPTCAAWLAVCHLNARRFTEMASMVKESLLLAPDTDHQAHARASLVLADAYHFGGRFDLARPWYEATRLHATAEGDESMISALLHNVAAFRVGNLRLADVLGIRYAEEARRASMEATSAAAYDRYVGTSSLAQYIPHVNAQLLVIEARYQEALDCLSLIDLSGLGRRSHAVHYVDVATCALHLGQTALLGEAIARAQNAIEDSLDKDDIVYVSCRLATIHETLGQDAAAAEAMARAKAEIVTFRAMQSALIDSLLNLTAPLLDKPENHRN